MIVAGAREAERVITNRARLIARWHLDRGDGDDAFEHPCDQGRRDAIVAIAPLLGDGDEPRLDELEEVLAGGRTRDSGEISEFAASQSLTTHEGSQDGRARGIPDERGEAPSTKFAAAPMEEFTAPAAPAASTDGSARAEAMGNDGRQFCCDHCDT